MIKDINSSLTYREAKELLMSGQRFRQPTKFYFSGI